MSAGTTDLMREAWREGWHAGSDGLDVSAPPYDTDEEHAAWADGQRAGALHRDTGDPAHRLRTNPYARRNVRRGEPQPLNAFDRAGLTDRCSRCRQPIRAGALYCDTVCASA